MNNDTIMAIDPGTRVVGWAVGEVETCQLVSCGIVTLKYNQLKLDTFYRVRAIATGLQDICLVHKPSIVVIECPRAWASIKGRGSALSGKLGILQFGFGYLVRALDELNFIKCYIPIPATKWKGQLPKEIMFERMIKKYCLSMKCTERNFNATDAIGLFNYYCLHRESAEELTIGSDVSTKPVIEENKPRNPIKISVEKAPIIDNFNRSRRKIPEGRKSPRKRL